MLLDTPITAFMTPLPRTVDVNDSLSDAWTWMLNGGFHHVPVVQEDQLVGILSSSDLQAVLRDLPPHLLDTGVVLSERFNVRTLMTPEPQTITVGDRLRDAADLLATGRYHALPVMDGASVVGIITSTDLVRAMLRAG